MVDTAKDFETLQPWRFAWDWLWTIGPIVILIWFCEKIYFGLYPIAALIIGNRLFRLATLGHEGLHHLISRNTFLNNFLARYLCYFPVFISFARAKSLHMLHHRFLGEGKDPDHYLFSEYPLSFYKWIRRILRDMLTMKILHDYFSYYSELIDRRRIALYKSDLTNYLLFWFTCGIGIYYFNLGLHFLLYWLVPLFFQLPLIQLVNGFQHGAIAKPLTSRSVIEPSWLIEALIPLDLNFHSEHHLNPRVPHYHLCRYSAFLNNNSTDLELNRSSLAQTLREVFPATDGKQNAVG